MTNVASLRLLVVLAFVWPLAAPAAGLPMASDLEADAALMKRKGVPLLVFFHSSACPYCQEVEELYLKPMHERGTYQDRLLIRSIDINSSRRLRDFNGRYTSHAEFSHDYAVWLVPNVLFLGPDGKELVPGLLGHTSPDFYAGDLELAIERSITRLRQRSTAAR